MALLCWNLFASRRVLAEFAPFTRQRWGVIDLSFPIKVSSHRLIPPSSSFYFLASIHLLRRRFYFSPFCSSPSLSSTQPYSRWMRNNAGKCEEHGCHLETLFLARSRRLTSYSFQVHCVTAFCPVLGPINCLSAGPALIFASFFALVLCWYWRSLQTLGHDESLFFIVFFFQRCNVRTTCLRADRNQGAGGFDPASLGGCTVSYYLPRL